MGHPTTDLTELANQGHRPLTHDVVQRVGHGELSLFGTVRHCSARHCLSPLGLCGPWLENGLAQID